MRTRLGNGLYSMKDSIRSIIGARKELTATAFIADQTPSYTATHWTMFLNQETPFFTGMAKIAKKMNYPIIFVTMDRVGRGKYHIESEELIAEPKNLSEEKITQIYIRKLEEDIRKHPAIWLWSHRRWKRTRPDDIPLYED